MGLCGNIPVGYLVDRRPNSRAWLCKSTAVVGFIATALMTTSILFESLELVFMALVVRELFYEVSYSVSNTIFSDSIPKGHKTDFFTNQNIIKKMSAVGGSALTAIIFYA